MLKKIILPEIGEGIDAVEITDIHINVGDKISKNEIIITVETEKASMEIPSELSGTIKKIFIKKGETLSPRSNLIELEINENNLDILLSNTSSVPSTDNNLKSNLEQTIFSRNNNFTLNSEYIYTSPSVRRGLGGSGGSKRKKGRRGEAKRSQLTRSPRPGALLLGGRDLEPSLE